MTTQAESRLSREIMKALRAKGIFCFKIHGGPTMLAGLPDIIACAEGYFIGLETKLPKTRADTSDRQEYVHQAIRQSGGVALVVCSPQEALKVVRQAIRNRSKDGQ